MNAPLENLFVLTTELPELGPGPRAGVLSIAEVKQRAEVVASAGGLSADTAAVLRALALLWHDHHDVAHGIVQDMPSADAAYVHAILHRREPDYLNAKYWFRRVGQHPCCAALAAAVVNICREEGASELATVLGPDTRWNAMAFVDACEAVAGELSESAKARALRKIQQTEFEILFKHLVSAVR